MNARARGPRDETHVKDADDRPTRSSGTYHRVPYTIDVSNLEYDDELTPVHTCCMSCKGRIFVIKETNRGCYSSVQCEWCTSGVMSGDQVNRFLSGRQDLEKQHLERELREFITNIRQRAPVR